ncbi:MAG: UDP-N-acetylmuramoyl-L-alanyl-D-glutamate--2,6-diaminopimelate ligase [Candidatus Omnitrophica bacterium]|nr:UDP-N-acetylmuramoyl-L-alanyl-D-glutamate--2,6-diaminopimelate ligase [Candidatus Omnitrophota bacterium]
MRQIKLSKLNITGLCSDSKEVKKGYLFVAVKGASVDGHKYIPDAVRNGAAVVVFDQAGAEKLAHPGVEFIQVSDSKKALLELAEKFYNAPAKKLKVIGVTGTNGKTTITYLLEAIFSSCGYYPAVIGTINYRYKGKVIAPNNTTPGVLQLRSLFSRFVDSGVDRVIMEVSSHALDQKRTAGIDFKAAIFTNLTQDHLDYHKTMQAYFKAKSLLFRRLRKDSIAVINDDDNFGRKLKKITRAKIVTYAIDNPADLTASNIEFDMHQTRMEIRWKGKAFGLRSNLIGRHNVYNILAAVAYCLKSGISIDKIKAAIEKFEAVPGRLERVKCDRGFSVFVDYAHTPDALKNVITTLRGLPCRRIITVFGCGGDRDKSKRPKMGKVASSLSDYAIITSDNPRSEGPKDIIKDIKKGIQGNNFCVIVERRSAIKKALSLARDGDIILLAGKGHENYQIIKNRKFDFDDRKVAKECLQ